MGLINLRSTIVAVIILCHCVTSTLSRHHYTHNILRHRSRHRRQGAGLFLSGSYVLPGGEGRSEGWGPWGEVSPCSRTCGGGVASQKRICLEIGRDGTPRCSGGDTKYFSCQTQDCPSGGDFRAEQCSHFDSTPLDGVYHTWVPYTKAPNPCELNCMPRGGRFYYRHKEKVVDGTRCNDESFDVCVDGTCQPVGCDMMLGSNAKEDKCRECRGNGTHCHTTSGRIDTQDVRQGYNDVLLIPQGATSIVISEVRASNNYLALRGKQNNDYYLNGDYHIDFPRSLMIAGCLWHYERSHQGFAAPDKLRSLGPTTEPLYLSLLLQEDNVGIDYEYSIPTALAPPPNQEYNWVHEEFTPCSATCGGGWQTRNVTCRSREELEQVDDTLCDDGLKPVTNATCNTQPCAARWVEGPWSPCSKPCGESGTRSRQVHCEKIITNGYPSVVDDKECFNILGPKPELYQECNKDARCPTWFTGPWKPCDKLCGEGKQTRQVVCHQKINGKVEVLEEGACADEKPAAEQSCYLHPCEGVDWVVSDWHGCDSCLSKVRTRTVECATKDKKVVNASLCNYHPLPVLEEKCENTPPCSVQWYATQWSNCSVQCGKGQQTRQVFCGIYDSLAVVKVDDSKCENETKYKDTKECEVPDDKCPARWFAGPWSECTKECGGGEQFRRVMCLSGGKEAADCDGEQILESVQPCNEGPCDQDETIPLTASTAQVMDEEDYDEECEEEEEEEEEGLEEEEFTQSTSADYMFSDSPSTPEGSGTEETEAGSELTSETGSGSEPTSEFTESTEPSGSTEALETLETGTTEVTETGVTEVSVDETGSTESSATETSGATDESSVSESGSTEVSSDADTTTEILSSSEASTEGSSSDASTTEEPSTTDASTTDASTTDASTTDASTADASTTEAETSGSTESATDSTTDSGTTDASSTESATETSTDLTGSTDKEGRSTESEATGSTETSITEETSSTGTEETGSTATEETGSTETGSTETTESGATEVTETGETGSTKSTIEVSTESESSTVSEESTPWDWTSTVEIFTKKGRCKPRKKKAAKCSKAKFGCCPDKRTPAAGPFDEGCPNPKTCKESKFGCCPDGVSPAAGPKDLDCPIAPCNETLYGCCKSDGKTAANGNNQEGCPPPPPKCKSSKYGCCADGKTAASGPKKKGCPENEKKVLKGCAASKHGCCPDNTTEASGPNGQGCPCNATQYGCCPDGVSTAAGPQMEGCVMSCNTSAYGCCPDGESPAHGPENEGCCLQYSFGCCPDNYSPAKGPHLEGCGCEYAHFGCCPDKVTIARGPRYEGCGCQYTQYGCCPDRHTEATGPNYEGCGCHTYQFGCCPDGVTIAKGQNLQGCHCSQSQHGCCGDGQTHAQGPNGEGCDCSSSKYGCCPDGQTEAKGDKFLGCTDIPENRQAGCALATDRGTCHNWTVTWFYDMTYGGCSRFWYGGCGGNDNRFTSKEECEDVCVHPPKTDVCKLPRSKGGCYGYHLRWYYDSERESCGQFVYGGCLGNDNNFETRESCQAQCEPARSDDQCKLPLERGTCAGNFSRWGFSSESGRCKQFIWGGCEGNSNRFGSEAACVQRCDPPGALKPDCQLPIQAGNCSEKLARWGFSQTENRCVPFYFTGCHGNGNNYQTEDECTSQCPSAFVQDSCTLPADVGDCADYRERWYFDTAAQRCRQFFFGGCGGNNNNFVTEGECEARCHRDATPPPEPTPPPQATPPTVRTTVAPVVDSGNSEQDFCLLEKDPGPCSTPETKWAFDAATGSCVTFQYGGCGGNRNNFPSQEYCNYYCQAKKDTCQLPMSAGPCSESQMRWFYDAASGTCSQFTYGGCEGNDNRFESREACEQRCSPRQAPAPTEPTIDARGDAEEEPLPSQCIISSTLEPCTSAGRVWYYDSERRECLSHDNMAAGVACRSTGVFSGQEACERACGAYRGLEVCRYSVDPGSCTESIPKFFFDAATGDCRPFNYGGCYGGPNRFSTVEECRQICSPQSVDPCSLRPEAGSCSQYLVRWYYDARRDHCAQFVFTGCNGNDNNFESRESCEGRCRRRPAATTPPPPQPPPVESEPECVTPDSLEPCGTNVTMFYYDSLRGECLAAGHGACAHPNTYGSVEECERRCGQFKGLEACQYPLDPGPCRQAVPKVYFDSATGRCQPFTYGGCHGGPNRFSSIEECEEVCQGGRADPSQNEVLPDCDAYIEECRSLQCPYGVQRTRSEDGCERCACVDVEVNCEPFTRECETLKCYYGMDRTVGNDGCERCRCVEHPCAGAACGAGERCVALPARDPLTQEPTFTAQCRTVNRPGTCPAEQFEQQAGESCRRECNDDADCADASAKCCERGCSHVCLSGDGGPTTARPSPELPQAPQANTRTEPEVMSAEGGKATLRCLFHGNPPPKITWRRGEVTIDGDIGRYRLLSDGALQIVSLYRNDSGVYICVADNGLGTATQEVRLQVNDPVETAAGIAGESAAETTGDLGQPLTIRCLAYGYPPPSVAWYRGATGPMVPYSSQQYEARGNTLLIRVLDVETLGPYQCQAYNGVDKPASWSVTVRAWRVPGAESPYLVSREADVYVTPPRPDNYYPAYTTTPPPPPAVYVPVSTRLLPTETRLSVGAELQLTCEVDGQPTASVHWTKDGERLTSNDRTSLSDSRLLVSRVTVNDTGLYGCHAANEYGTHFSTVPIQVEGLYIPPSCKDNPFFADCNLIVRSKFCRHKYYSKICCKSCMEAGQILGWPADQL